MVFGFKVGDVVKFHVDQYANEINDAMTANDVDDDYEATTSLRATVIAVGHRLNGQQWMNYRVQLQNGDTFYVRSQWITLCTECNEENKRALSAEKSPSMGVIGNAVAKVREIAMSSDERLLKKYGVVDTCGNVTDDGKDLLIELLFADDENKKAIVAKLKEIDTEAEKEKKRK